MLFITKMLMEKKQNWKSESHDFEEVGTWQVAQKNSFTTTNILHSLGLGSTKVLSTQVAAVNTCRRLLELFITDGSIRGFLKR